MATPAHKSTPLSHWSKDYVEHLRTVHFTLVVVCIALVVLITSDRKSAVSNARAELRSIKNVVEAWDESWVEKEAAVSFANKRVASDHLPVAQFLADASHSEIEVDMPNGKREVMQLVYDGPNWMVNSRDNSLRTSVLSRYPLLLQYRPLFMEWFHDFWDLLAKDLKFEVPVVLDDTPLAFHEYRPLKARFVTGKAPTVVPAVHLKLSIMQIVNTVNADYRYEYPKGFYASDPVFQMPFLSKTATLGDAIVVPVARSEPVFFDTYTRFITANPGWRREPYNDAFPNLSSLTKNYEKMNLDTVDKVLESEESRAGDSFEAIGIKFPAEGVTRWGIILIFGIQLYLFLHLHELGPKLRPTDEGFEVAWVGVYKSSVARVITFLTIALLPACAAFVLAWHMPMLTRGSWWLRLVALVVGTALSLLLGSLAWITASSTSRGT